MLPYPSERLDSLIEKNEFKIDQSPVVKIFRNILRKSFLEEEIESFWQESYAFLEDLSFYEWNISKFKMKSPFERILFKIQILRKRHGKHLHMIIFKLVILLCKKLLFPKEIQKFLLSLSRKYILKDQKV